ncbi:SDR family NAD(P)-dependent oxidoreductase [Subtercola frigoramans]|uniref:NAD(P)-dependent dehydrogenase (Short-subunit alcohol dehydrogenase family) n=1 Tax=Subtercola frigoramans TaxID=120298 RepID=A0ABS2L7G1_9MICO|nr:SDR family NAD(P)-dependent oxidoreductase [Subtercola frigoramans]MBM7473023.1 NAD(P)-dependent dehydrogenase (short-subunit alcohol dehydrogenase family) [Subtercola frigoramans]
MTGTLTGPLSGRVAFVAGGSGPVGRAISRTLSGMGASVAVHYRSSASAAHEFAETLDSPSIAVGARFDDRAEVDAAFTAVESALGPVTILVNAAHTPSPVTAFAEVTDSQLDAQFDSTRGHVVLAQRALPGMRRAGWGRVVYLSGALMTRPYAGFSAYAAAKSAASTFTRYIALEEGVNGITATVVALGRVIDPDDDEPLDEAHQQFAERLLDRMALSEFPCVDDVAGVVSLAVGPHSTHLTGQTLWVTGGEPIA